MAALLAAGHTPDAAERKEVKQHAQVAVAAQKEKQQAHQLKVSEAKGGKPPTLTAKRGKPGGGLKGGSSKTSSTCSRRPPASRGLSRNVKRRAATATRCARPTSDFTPLNCIHFLHT